MSLTLYVATGGTKDFQDSEKDLKSIAEFSKAIVKKGTWIFYKYKEYNDKPDNKESWVKVLTPSEHEVDISNVNGSVYYLPPQTEGIYLFEHAFYGGHRKYYNSDCRDVNPDFPSSKIGGVSSAIVVGGKFDVFTKTGGNGVSSTLTKGTYPTPAVMNIANDSIQSIQRLN